MSSDHIGFDASGKKISLSPEDRKTHMHVIGSSGSGKSKFLEWLMRGDIQNRQGFCLIDPHGTLYDDVVSYVAHNAVSDVVLLNLSSPESIVGFNPFQKSPSSDISVQVDRRITATMHAWNVANTDQTPTLERMLRLLYTVMLDQSLGLPEVQHLINFNARSIREQLIDKIQSPLIQNEWREIQELRAADWRAETLSAKNRLFRLLTSPTLARFMGLPDRTLNLGQLMDEGKTILVNLAASDYLSKENARVFGALLVNEFFEHALRRKRNRFGEPPPPYYLYLDEFQNFVSLDLIDMLDEARKFGLFLVMAHQRFGQLDPNIIDAMMTNCKIKAVFGGLPAESAQVMARELFIDKLDPLKIKVAIKQTKFWPQYKRDKVYSSSTSHATGSSTGQSSGSGLGSNMATGEFFQGADWLGSRSVSTSVSESSSEFSFAGSGESTSESFGETEGVADIPVIIPVPFEELSSIQFYTLDEQLSGLTAALKEQFERHAFIKIRQQETQPMLVPFVESYYTSQKNLERYKEKVFAKQKALKPAEVDRLISVGEQALLQSAGPTGNDRVAARRTAARQDKDKQQAAKPPKKTARSELNRVFGNIKEPS